MSPSGPSAHSAPVPAWSECVERIRVLLAELPRMLSEIIESVIADQQDMSIVGAIDSRDRVTSALVRTPADVVIVGLRDAETTASLNRVLLEQPRLKLLAISGDERSSYLYELRPHTVSLGDISPQGLVDAIRGAVVTEVR
jgi:DNA-binding NarL/FixJ family response regulator